MLSNLELHPKCNGCEKLNALDLCSVYLEPIKQWSKLPISSCAMKPKAVKDEKKDIWVDPIKASKRGIKQ